MQTHFSAQTLAEVFRDLYLSERTGVLALSRSDSEKQIYFERGLILLAESQQEGLDLGSRLVQEGKISPGALDEARRSIEQPQDLGLALVNRGLIAKALLPPTARKLIDDIVRSVFQWEGGTARFDELPGVPEVFESDVLATCEVILHGIGAMTGFEPIFEAMQGLDNRLRVRRPTPVPLERLTLSPQHGFILSRVDGSTTVRDVLSILPPDEEASACRFLFGLLLLGVLEYDPPVGDGPFRVANILRDHADRQALERLQEQTIRQAYTQMREQNPYQVLGVSHSASAEAIERAYEEAKALFSRDRILPRVREKQRSELAVIESRLIEAYLKLTQPETDGALRAEHGAAPREEHAVEDLLMRVELDKTKSKLALEEASKVADTYYAKARKAVREGDYHNAVQYGKLAISYNQQDARFYYLLGECQARNPEARWQRMAEQNFNQAATLDPWNPEYRITLGRFYKKRGMSLRARRQFEEALKLSPSNETATAELKSLGK
ncbi:MAG TPA: DUF4388 domain-containing protein [Candidatus Polarisedimenticolaceae bacterium]|nr:DUF4388 domain-containing protein [Candidatus Polarisedimenticolaceae bacterium]